MGSVNVWGESNESSKSGDVVAINSKVDRNGDKMHGNLDMNKNKIIGLTTNMYEVTEDNEAVSHRVFIDVLDDSIKRKINKDGDNITGDTYLKIGLDKLRVFGCDDILYGKGFSLLLGNMFNQIQYERNFSMPQPVKVLSSDGILFLIDNDEILRIGASAYDKDITAYKPIHLMMGLDANNNVIYNMSDPVGDSDAVTKRYVDSKVTKCISGLVPYLANNTDYSNGGYEVSASSEYDNKHKAFNVFRYGNYDWATQLITEKFWIKIKCLEQLRVWRFSTVGREHPNEEFISWRFEGSNDDFNWLILKSESNYPIALSPTYGLSFVEITTTNLQYFQYYRLYVVQSNPLGNCPGLKHFQIYVYNE